MTSHEAASAEAAEESIMRSMSLPPCGCCFKAKRGDNVDLVTLAVVLPGAKAGLQAVKAEAAHAREAANATVSFMGFRRRKKRRVPLMQVQG